MFDLVIRDALLLDGLGSPPRRGGVAVKDGRIAEVGRILGSSRETVVADGLALMPGIIDNHTHYDAQLTWDPWASPSPALGVTTAIIGNCGFTIAPCRPHDRDRVMKKVMADPRLAKMMNPKKMPFDGKRMIWGGFKPFIQM